MWNRARSIATIVTAHGACGSSGKVAADVTIRATQRLHVLVLLLVRDDIVGKIPTTIVPGLHHVLVEQAQPKGSRYASIKVVRLGLPMGKSTLATLPHFPRALPRGTVCY